MLKFNHNNLIIFIIFMKNTIKAIENEQKIEKALNNIKKISLSLEESLNNDEEKLDFDSILNNL